VPAFLALVGDTADGIPGIARWGEKGAAAVLNRYLTIDAIPADGNTWDVNVRGKAALATELNAAREEAALYEKLATLRTDVPLPEALDDLRWRGPNMAELKALCSELDSEDLLDRFTDTDL
jgi:5'-3' exonuclease